MRLFYALALACGFSTVLLAQERPTCTVPGNTPSSSFELLCRTNITPAGVITGTIIFQFSEGQSFTLPTSIGSGENQQLLSLGDANFIINSGRPQGNPNDFAADTLRIPDAYLIDASATDFSIRKTGRGRNITFFDRSTYGQGGGSARRPLSALQALVRALAVAAPIELISWTATPENNAVNLAWSSAMEYNNAYYGIEHSTDGTSFTEVTRVAGQEFSIEQLDYTYLHPTPAAGTNYYRLTQTDLDGTRTVFNVLTVTVDGTTATTLFPNPASAGTSIRLGTAPTTVETTLHHLDGRLITRYPAGLQRLPLPGDLATGLYLVRSGERISRLLVR